MSIKAEARLTRARQQSTLARQALTESLVDLQTRLSPRNLVGEAMDEARLRAERIAEQLVGKVRARPASAVGVLAAFLIFLGRGWIAAKLSAIIARQHGKDMAMDESQERDDG